MGEEKRDIIFDGVPTIDTRDVVYDASSGKFEYAVDTIRQASTKRGVPSAQDTETTLYTGRFVATTIHIINANASDVVEVSIRDGTGLANDIFRDLTVNADSIIPLEGVFNFDTSIIVNVNDANFADIWFVFGGYVVADSSP